MFSSAGRGTGYTDVINLPHVLAVFAQPRVPPVQVIKDDAVLGDNLVSKVAFGKLMPLAAAASRTRLRGRGCSGVASIRAAQGRGRGCPCRSGGVGLTPVRLDAVQVADYGALFAVGPYAGVL